LVTAEPLLSVFFATCNEQNLVADIVTIGVSLGVAGATMKLAGIAIQKYRSIRKTPRLNLGDLTVLVGPNNEGKSNILRAMAISMRLLRIFSSRPRVARQPSTKLRLRSREYDWFEDFPKDLQTSTPQGNTIIDLWFELSDVEKTAFHNAVGVRLKTELPIRLTLNKDVEFAVRKQGPSRETLMKKSGQIAYFIGRSLRVEYVQSVRTAEDAATVVRNMLSAELDFAMDSGPFADALTSLRASLEPALAPISAELGETLSTFLPEVSSMHVEIPVDDLVEALVDRCRILVNDGVETELRFKGDGVQSLAAMALLRKSATFGRHALFLALEEPEAHLHPRAIHQVRQVLKEIAEKQQVAVTTHSPVLVDRFNLTGNIIVRSNKASPAKSLEELREALGVRAADNLSSAALVILVEGACDRAVLAAVFMDRSESLATAIESGAIAIESLGGASNLASRLDILRQQVCRYMILVDYDEAGRAAVERATKDGLLLSVETHYTTVRGMKESELEDCLDTAGYLSIILSQFGVNLDCKEFKNSKKKWSERVSDAFHAQGKGFDDREKVMVKTAVAHSVEKSPGNALHSEKSTALFSLIREVERMLSDVQN
jgi:energy-coupling factor transporter ATP-binding protein EcfA2